jgi:hypothetical protein
MAVGNRLSPREVITHITRGVIKKEIVFLKENKENQPAYEG